jgi:two-component sensor histidine kinase
MSDGEGVPDQESQARIRHRVANTFHFLAALARMRAQRAGDPSPGHALSWMADTIVDLGTLERFFRDDQADISAYLTSMGQVWRDRYRRRNLEVVLDLCPLTLSETAAQTVVLCALELVANAASHTFVGDVQPEVRLVLQPAADGYELSVSDTGFGMASQTDSFGLWLVRRLAQQIKGELTLTPDGGASLAFRP